jgi:hypothetical protein
LSCHTTAHVAIATANSSALVQEGRGHVRGGSEIRHGPPAIRYPAASAAAVDHADTAAGSTAIFGRARCKVPARGGERLHYWVMGGQWTYDHEPEDFAMSGADKEFLDELTGNLGAGVCGRGMYDASEAWGGTNPFDGPLFVVTHRTEDAPDPSGSPSSTASRRRYNARRRRRRAATCRSPAAPT